MRKHNAALVAALMAWICPPPAPGRSTAIGELQRVRISHYLPPIFLAGWFASATAFLGRPASMDEVISSIVMPIVFSAIFLTLCHYRHAYLAALLFCAVMTCFMVFSNRQPDILPGVSALFMVIPICIGGVLFGPRACWWFTGGIILAIMLHVLRVPAQNMAYIIGMLLFCTMILALGMRGFHQALREADRGEELAALNEQLAAGLSAIAAREKEANQQRQASERAHAELQTVFDNVQDALIVFGVDMRPRHINEASKRIFGLTNESADIVAHARSHFQATLLDGTPLPPEKFLPTRVLQGEQPSPPRHTRVRRYGAESVILLTHAVPLKDATGTCFGALNISRDVTAEYYSARNLQVMQAIGQVCASAAEVAVIADTALYELMRGLDLTGGAILLRDDDRPGYARILVNRTERVLSSAEIAELTAKVADTPIADDAPVGALRAIATGKAIFSHPCELPITGKFLQGKDQDTVACVPLTVNGSVAGAISFSYSSQRAAIWEDADIALMLAAADEIATSLQRARLYEEARRLALFDPLTGLHNHRALQDILQRELTRGNAQSLPVSLIMLDIDHFRHFNENNGHDVGDRALRAVAHVIRAALAEGAYAARFGGEEFAIVLPGIDGARAQTIANEMCATIAQCPIIGESPADYTRLLTASAGHATFPIHASAAASLLKAADLALYAAKRAGRNRVTAYTPTLLEDHSRLVPSLISARSRNVGEIQLPSGADIEAVQALITAVDLRDGYTAAHSEGVSRYSVAIATEMGLPAEHIEALRLGGLVHDVGKIGVPDIILRKPGKLTDEEWVLMRAHTTMGEEILRHVEQLGQLLPLVRWHHERLDGSGYPDQLQGEEIPHLVRILSVADVFEAFTAERPYHPGRPASEGLRLLQREVQQQRMDASIVAAFEALLVNQGLVDVPVRGEQDLQDAA